MKSPSVDIASILHSNGLGVVGESIFVTKLPDSPDSLIVVSSTTSREPDTLTSTNNIDKPNIQIFIRKKSGQNDSGYTLAESIKNLLHGKLPFTLNGAKYHSIYAISDIGELGVDEKLRPVFSINFRIERSKV